MLEKGMRVQLIGQAEQGEVVDFTESAVAVRIDGAPDDVYYLAPHTLAPLSLTESGKEREAEVVRELAAERKQTTESLTIHYAYAHGYVAATAEGILRKLEAACMILGPETDPWLSGMLSDMAREIKDSLAHAQASLYS